MADEQAHIKDLLPDPLNRRTRTERSAGMLEKSLEEVGAGRSVLIDEHNQLIAGNGVVEACASVGITKVRIVEAAGDVLIAVRRSNLSSEQKRKASIYDNRTGELSAWVPDALQQDVNSGADLSMFFTPKELAKVLTTTPTEISTGAAKLAKTCVCPSCGHTFTPL